VVSLGATSLLPSRFSSLPPTGARRRLARGWAGSGHVGSHSRGFEDREPAWPCRRRRNQAVRREGRLPSERTLVLRARGSGQGRRCSRSGRSCSPMPPVAGRSPGPGWVPPQFGRNFVPTTASIFRGLATRPKAEGDQEGTQRKGGRRGGKKGWGRANPTEVLGSSYGDPTEQYRGIAIVARFQEAGQGVGGLGWGAEAGRRK
jgi:hypothetical protein